MSQTHLFEVMRSSFVASFVIAALLIISFFTLEPQVGRSATDTFLVTQQITNEIAFVVNAGDVTMVGSIQGLTGGYATGTTYTVVRSNNPTGYNMTIGFSSTTAMSASSSAYINNYSPAGAGVPDFSWIDNASGQSAEFGYSILASTTAETDASFLNDGAACNTGSSATAERCWYNKTDSSVAETLINSNAPSVSSSTTIKFKVAVPSNPSPALPAAFYVATATLTATNNP